MQYTLSLHWSLSQFTPASMEVFPQNLTERVFNVVVILFAMVSFSSFVSSITSGMTRLGALKNEKVKQHYLLRRYLTEQHISYELTARITRYISLVAAAHQKAIHANKVEMLSLLTGPLRLELQHEIFFPSLQMHPLLERYGQVCKDGIQDLCASALKKVLCAKGECIFRSGMEASGMYFVVNGALRYRNVSLESGVLLRRGQWLSEAVLWMPWLHMGTARAVLESEMAVLDACKFVSITWRHPDAFRMCKEHAEQYLEQLRRSETVLDIAPDVAAQQSTPALGEDVEVSFALAMEAQIDVDSD